MSNPVKDGVERASSLAGERFREASARIHETGEAARQTVAEAYAAARQKAGTAYEAAKEATTETGKRAGGVIDENPVVAIAGGIALGALVAALLPRSQRESAYLGGIGQKIISTARGAVDAAKNAGRETFADFGISGDTARDKVSALIDTAIRAAGSASEAASASIRK